MDFPTAIGAGASAAAVGGALVALWQGARSIYWRTVGRRRALRGNLDKLSLGVTQTYIEELFGAAMFRRRAERVGDRECVYRCCDAWLTIWYDQEDAVTLYSITVTDRRLAFGTKWLTNDRLDIALGVSAFGDVTEEPKTRSIYIGANFYRAGEGFYFGRPGRYLDYVLSCSNAGCGRISSHAANDQSLQDWQEDWRRPELVPPKNRAELAAFRAETIIDTLTVTKLDEHHFADDVLQWVSQLAETTRPYRVSTSSEPAHRLTWVRRLALGRGGQTR